MHPCVDLTTLHYHHFNPKMEGANLYQSESRLLCLYIFDAAHHELSDSADHLPEIISRILIK